MKESKGITDRQRKESIVTRSQLGSKRTLREELNKNLTQRSSEDSSGDDFDVFQIDDKMSNEKKAEQNQSIKEKKADNENNKFEKKSKLVKESRGTIDRQGQEKVVKYSQLETPREQLNKNLSQRSEDNINNNNFEDSQADDEMSNENTAEQNQTIEEMGTNDEKNKSEKKSKHVSSKNIEYAKPDANKITVNITVKTLQISRSKANTLAMSQASVAVIVS